MNKLLLAGAVTALTLVASHARAADTMNPDSTAHDSMNQQDTMNQKDTTSQNAAGLMGTVKEIDTRKNMITLQVPLAPGASVLRDGKSVGLDTVKKGDDVRADFDATTNTITHINVEAKGTTKTTDPYMNK